MTAALNATVPPRCDSCHQPLPWLPPLCTCGHAVGSHHQTDTGNLTYCCAGDGHGNCPCPRYEHATDGHHGPLEVPA